jgi:hypothetical protein
MSMQSYLLFFKGVSTNEITLAVSIREGLKTWIFFQQAADRGERGPGNRLTAQTDCPSFRGPKSELAVYICYCRYLLVTCYLESSIQSAT